MSNDGRAAVAVVLAGLALIWLIIGRVRRDGGISGPV